MSDFDELIDYLIEVIGEVIEKIPNEELVENVQDTIQSVWDKLSNSEYEIDEEHKEILIDKLADALNLSPDVVSDHIDIITHADSASFEDLTTEKVSEVSLADNKTWDGEFTSAGCWDECIASVDDPSKRLTCGYHC